MQVRTVADVVNGLLYKRTAELKQPQYVQSDGINVGFAVESMSRHMTDEGWQLFLGLYDAGYTLHGKGITTPDVSAVHGMKVALVQDKREWEGKTADRSGELALINVGCLRDQVNVFKGTVLKDAQHDSLYNWNAAHEIGAHFWVTYYHPTIVKHLSSFVREQHLVRTYHSVDKHYVPDYKPRSRSCILSGAVSGAYPLRTRLFKSNGPWMKVAHPGYHRKGTDTPQYLRLLSQHKVAICTSSVYGYAVRKIIEATACGCKVLTDLPIDDVLPHIDGNLFRVHPYESTERIITFVDELTRTYDPSLQQHYAELAKQHYDYRVLGSKLADDIEMLRQNYNG
jgi:hypothetical protein